MAHAYTLVMDQYQYIENAKAVLKYYSLCLAKKSTELIVLSRLRSKFNRSQPYHTSVCKRIKSLERAGYSFFYRTVVHSNYLARKQSNYMYCARQYKSQKPTNNHAQRYDIFIDQVLFGSLNNNHKSTICVGKYTRTP